MKKRLLSIAAIVTTVCMFLPLLTSLPISASPGGDPWETGTIDVTSSRDNFVIPPALDGVVTYAIPDGFCNLTGGVFTANVLPAFQPSGGGTIGLMKTNTAKVPLKYGAGEKYTIAFDWGNLNTMPDHTATYPNSGSVTLYAFNNEGKVVFTQPLLAPGARTGAETGIFNMTMDFSKQTGGAWGTAPSAGDDIFLLIAGNDVGAFSVSDFTIEKIAVTPPDPWETGTIDVTSSRDNFVIPPALDGVVTYAIPDGFCNLTGGVFTANVLPAFQPSGGGTIGLMKTNTAKVPLKYGAGEKYTIAFDWGNLNTMPDHTATYPNSGSVTLYAFNNEGKVVFTQPLLAPGARTGAETGTFNMTMDFSKQTGGAWGTAPSAGDDIFLLIAGNDVGAFSVSDFTIEKIAVTPPDPWETGTIDVTSSRDNFVIPPALDGVVTYAIPDGFCNLTGGVFTANVLSAFQPSGGGTIGLMKTNTAKVPLKYGAGEKYTIAFDWKNLNTLPDYTATYPNSGSVTLYAFNNEGKVVFTQPLLAPGARTGAETGTFNMTMDFSKQTGGAWGTAPSAGDDIFLLIAGNDVGAFSVSDFTIEKIAVTPPDPWETGTIDVTSSRDNFVIPPALDGVVTYAIPDGFCNLTGGVFTANVLSAFQPSGGGTIGLMKTNTAKVPLKYGAGEKYTIAFDWGNLNTMPDHTATYPNSGSVTLYAFNNEGKVVFTQPLLAPGARTGAETGTFNMTMDFSKQTGGAWGTPPSAGDDIFLLIAGNDIGAFSVSDFTIEKIAVTPPDPEPDPDPWETGTIDVTSSSGNFVIPPNPATVGKSYIGAGGSYTLKSGAYNAAAPSQPTGQMGIMETNIKKVPLKFGPGEKYTVRFDWKVTAPGATIGAYSGLVTLRAVSVQNNGIITTKNLTGISERLGIESGTFDVTIDFSIKDSSSEWALTPNIGDDMYLCIYGFDITGFEISNFTVIKGDPPPIVINPSTDPINVVATDDIKNFIIPPVMLGADYTAHQDYSAYSGDYTLKNGVYKAESYTALPEWSVFGIMKTNPEKIPLKYGASKSYQIEFDWEVLHNSPAPSDKSPYSGMVELRAVGLNGGLAFNDYVLIHDERKAGEKGKFSATINFSKQSGIIAAWPEEARPASPKLGDYLSLYLYGVDIQGFSIKNLIIKEADLSEEDDDDFGDLWSFYDPSDDILAAILGNKKNNSIVFGYLRDENKEPLSDVALCLESDFGDLIQTFTETDGYFEFLDVPPGTYKFYMIDENGEMIWSGLEFEVEAQQLIKLSAVYDGVDLTAKVIRKVFFKDWIASIPKTGQLMTNFRYLISAIIIATVVLVFTAKRRKKRHGTNVAL